MSGPLTGNNWEYFFATIRYSATSLASTAWTADLVLVSIGALPNDQVATNADIITDNSICGDQYGRSSVTKYMGKKY